MPTIDDVERYLAPHGLEVLRFETHTPDSISAARAAGCEVGQIAKTLLFVANDTPVAVVTSGDVKVRSGVLKRTLGLTGKVRLPDSADVERMCGYLPGGVCPFLLPPGLKVVIDESLKRFEMIYPAAGDDHSLVGLKLAELIELTGGEVVSVCTEPQD